MTFPCSSGRSVTTPTAPSVDFTHERATGIEWSRQQVERPAKSIEAAGERTVRHRDPNQRVPCEGRSEQISQSVVVGALCSTTAWLREVGGALECEGLVAA